MSDTEQAMDALESVAGDSGGAAEQVAGGDAGSTGGTEENALPEFQPFTWKDGDKEYAFSRRAELTDWLSSRSKQQQEAIRRAQERAQHFEKRHSELSAKEQALQQAYGKWARIDEAMSKNPQVAQRIQQAFQEAQRSGNGSPDLDRLLEEKVKPIQEKLSQYEKAEQQRQAEARRQQAISRLRETHGEVDDKRLLAELNRLQEIPEEDQEYALYELLHFALQGKSTPAEVEKKFAEQSAKKRPPSVTSTPGRGKSEPDVTKMSRAEQREYAMRFLEG